ncbi:MAG: DUF3131 domain-containing protein [Caldilinea sp. CFX5]|nr:DUF3131 domain-containing protein [Caldilinea sp. CFX5]
MKRKTYRCLNGVLSVLVLILFTTPMQAQGSQVNMQKRSERETLQMYATATWQSFVVLTHPNGLPADNINAAGERAGYTSPTNIGAYIWSTLAARDLQIIKPEEARDRIGQTLQTLAALERHAESGQYYNWYDPATGAKLTTWPPTGDPVYPFLSSVDNGWLATALIMVTNSVPQWRDQAQAILDRMNFGFYYDPNAGLLRGGYWPAPPPGGCHANGFTCHHYGTLNTEPRIASYIAIARGQVPPTHYFKMWRTFPDTCDWSWQEMKPEGVWRNYLDVDVYEGHYTYQNMQIVPSWGGSMFEALMVPLFVPEERWGERSWGINHPLYVQAQILHGATEAGYGYWGFSPANNPAGGYREYGVDAIGLRPDGYASNNDNTLVDYGFGDCPDRPPQPIPPPSAYTNGVVTPHAVFLALDFAPEASLSNLEALRANFAVYGEWGFWDSVNVSTGEVARYVLALDQGMVMMALGNALRNDRLQHYFAHGMVETAIRPLLAVEEFTAGAASDMTPGAFPVAWLLPSQEQRQAQTVDVAADSP